MTKRCAGNRNRLSKIFKIKTNRSAVFHSKPLVPKENKNDQVNGDLERTLSEAFPWGEGFQSCVFMPFPIHPSPGKGV